MALGSIILLDILLGGDNAVVIAMAANKLPANLRRKAILIGTGGAVVIRLVMTLIAVWLLTIPFTGLRRPHPAAHCCEIAHSGRTR